MTETGSKRIVILGATGFVGAALRDALADSGHRLVCTSRSPKASWGSRPRCEWKRVDLDQPSTLEDVFEPGDVVFYLVHAMSDSGSADFMQKEMAAARAVAESARANGVERIIYLGGPDPPGETSKHLRSRLETGRILRNSGVPTFELRASMIIGKKSESWAMVRDLAARLPVMVIPRWLQNVTEPIAIEDVVAALVAAVGVPVERAEPWGLPGPERLSFEEILVRTAALRGTKPRRIRVPLLSPTLSSHWLRLVTRANFSVAKELVEGLRNDLLVTTPSFFDEFMPDHELVGFDAAAAAAMTDERSEISPLAEAIEALLKRAAAP